MNAKTCIIFGGTGCIGTHLALHWMTLPGVERIQLADLRPLRADAYAEPVRAALAGSSVGARVEYVPCDVRQPITQPELAGGADLIVNLAAVHREPGHEHHEYYQTNLPGAENVCAYAARTNSQHIVFTSSIAPYGSADGARDEDSIPMPETAYGGSKLVAEKMHIAWQHGASGRKLAILRPGVVFGAGEHANVARLARSLARGYFAYMANRDTRKAGVYVKELCGVLQFAVEHQEQGHDPVLVWNVSMDPPPTLSEYVHAICAVGGFREPKLSVPRGALVAASYPIAAAAGIVGRRTAISPVRMRKVSQPTHIEPKRLRELGYNYRYTMEQAMADWKKDAPEDFIR